MAIKVFYLFASLLLIFPGMVVAQEEVQEQIEEEQTEIIISTKPESGLRSVFVERIIDGDTIITDEEERIRYIGMNTPETVHPSKPVEFFGEESSRRNTELVEGKIIELEFDIEETDRYGRTLAYVWLGGEMINAKLLAEGYAQVSTYPPNVKYVDYFLFLQEEARINEMGLWAFEDNEIMITDFGEDAETEPIPSNYNWLWWLGGIGLVVFWVYKWIGSRY